MVLEDGTRSGRRLPTEVWYPATAAYKGQDLAEDTRDRYEVLAGLTEAWQSAVRDATAAEGRFPLIVFSHGYGGERRQSSFFGSHLASHGYVVAAPDHTGNTFADIAAAVMGAIAMGAKPRDPNIRQAVEDRPRDVVFVVDELSGDSQVDSRCIGFAGHSFGGWTALTATARDQRVAAVLPLAPAGGSSVIAGQAIAGLTELSWGREVPTLFIVAERDSLLPLAGMHELFGRTGSPKRMVVLLNADHMHFCDRPRQAHEMLRTVPGVTAVIDLETEIPPFSELCPAAHGLDATRGLGLAHFDGVLKGIDEAVVFGRDQAMSALSRRGIDVDLVR